MVQITQNHYETACHMEGTTFQILAESMVIVRSLVKGISARNPIAGAVLCSMLKRYTDGALRSDFIEAASGKTEFEKSEYMHFDADAIKDAFDKYEERRKGETEGGEN